jgi:anaerobic ribonucleoside-triphosphate reductase activating protein
MIQGDAGSMVPLARIETSLADDPECGVSIAVFVAGCRRRCKGCQNPELQSAERFRFVPIGDVVRRVQKVIDASSGLIDSMVFVGGEWMLYPSAYIRLAMWARGSNLKRILYTGETYEDLPDGVKQITDWVIDGPWREDLPGIYPPSTNQRVFRRGELVPPEELPLFQHLKSRKPEDRGENE